jgi:hypothetical protein
MVNRRLLEILCRLNEEEKRKFRHFLQSPYFVYGYGTREILRLYDYIMEYGADAEHPQLDKQQASSFLFPDQVFIEKSKNPVDKYTSDLLKLLKRFLYQQDVDQKTDECSINLPVAHFYRKHGLGNRYWPVIEEMKVFMDSVAHRNERHYLSRYFLETEIHKYKAIYSTNQEDVNVIPMIYCLETFFAVARMELENNLINISSTSNLEGQVRIGLPDTVVDLIKEGQFKNEPLLELLIQANDLIRVPEDPVLLETFENLLSERKSLITPLHLSQFQAILRTILVKHYQKNSSIEVGMKMFGLMQQHLSDGAVFIDGKLPYTFLVLFLNCGLTVRAYETVKKTLDEFPPGRLCGTRFPVEMHNLTYAKYYLAVKNYQAALNLLEHRNFENVNISILAEVVQIKVYYETGNDLLEYRMNAAIQKIRRSNIASSTKKYYFNFFKKLDKVIKYGWEKNSRKKEKLKAEIRDMEVLYERDWLMEQLGD